MIFNVLQYIPRKLPLLHDTIVTDYQPLTGSLAYDLSGSILFHILQFDENVRNLKINKSVSNYAIFSFHTKADCAAIFEHRCIVFFKVFLEVMLRR